MEDIHFHAHYSNQRRKYPIIIISIITLAIILYLAYSFLSPSQITSLLIAIVIISILFSVLAIIHKGYERVIVRTHPFFTLIAGYIIIAISAILTNRLYSIEWTFITFIVVAVIYYDFRVDSRFLILPALFLLGYIPFLLIAKQQTHAETIAIYVYYFLVVGVITQAVEYFRERRISLDFDEVSKEILNLSWKTTSILLGIASIILFIADRFYELAFYKWTILYVFIVSLIIYGISLIKKEETYQHAHYTPQYSNIIS